MKFPERIPLKKIIGLIGVALILAGYLSLGIDPDIEPAMAIKRAFAGMGLIIVGAALSLWAVVFA